MSINAKILGGVSLWRGGSRIWLKWLFWIKIWGSHHPYFICWHLTIAKSWQIRNYLMYFRIQHQWVCTHCAFYISMAVLFEVVDLAQITRPTFLVWYQKPIWSNPPIQFEPFSDFFDDIASFGIDIFFLDLSMDHS